jgi:hypothetical protein
MLVTVILCLLSTVSFCFCARGLVAVGTASRGAPLVLNRHGFSVAAWRLARGYTAFALTVLAVMSFIGIVVSYMELFSLGS